MTDIKSLQPEINELSFQGQRYVLIDRAMHSETQEEFIVYGADNAEIEFLACPGAMNLDEIECCFQSMIQLKTNLPVDIRKGRHKHFKGAEYEVIGIAKHIITQENLVVYRAMYDAMALWIRPVAMFYEEIERDGCLVQRFSAQTDSIQAGL